MVILTTYEVNVFFASDIRGWVENDKSLHDSSDEVFEERGHCEAAMGWVMMVVVMTLLSHRMWLRVVCCTRFDVLHVCRMAREGTDVGHDFYPSAKDAAR